MTAIVSYEKIWAEIVNLEGGSVRSNRKETVEALFPDLAAAAAYIQGLEMQFIPEGVSIWVSPD